MPSARDSSWRTGRRSACSTPRPTALSPLFPHTAAPQAPRPARSLAAASQPSLPRVRLARVVHNSRAATLAPHLDLPSAHDLDLYNVLHSIQLSELEVLLVVVAGTWGVGLRRGCRAPRVRAGQGRGLDQAPRAPQQAAANKPPAASWRQLCGVFSAGHCCDCGTGSRGGAAEAGAPRQPPANRSDTSNPRPPAARRPRTGGCSPTPITISTATQIAMPSMYSPSLRWSGSAAPSTVDTCTAAGESRAARHMEQQLPTCGRQAQQPAMAEPSLGIAARRSICRAMCGGRLQQVQHQPAHRRPPRWGARAPSAPARPR